MNKQKISIDEMGNLFCNAALLNSIDDFKTLFKIILLFYTEKEINKILNFKNKNGSTPLMSSGMRHDDANLLFLLNKNVDVSITNNAGKNFIDNAHIFNTMFNGIKDIWKDYNFQKKIFEKDSSLIKSFIERKIPLHPDIKHDFAQIINCIELNIL